MDRRRAKATTAVDDRGSSSSTTGHGGTGGRWLVLDMVRVVAAGLVFLHHLAAIGNLPLTQFAANGREGVPAFFALSGFLVYRPFLYREIAPWPYLRRRFSRVLPALLAAILACALVLSGQLAWLDGVMWTLVIELEFYALLPFIARLSRGHELPVLGGMATLSYVGAQFAPEVDPTVAPLFGPVVFWCFAAGMLVAVAERDLPALTGRAWLLVGIPLAVIAAWVPGVIWTDALPAIATALIIAGSLNIRAKVRWLAFAADASYPWYLWHAPLLAAIAVAYGGFGLVAFGLAGTAIAATLSVAVVEPSIRRLSGVAEGQLLSLYRLLRLGLVRVRSAVLRA